MSKPPCARSPRRRDAAAAPDRPPAGRRRRCGTVRALPPSPPRATPWCAKFLPRNGPSGWYSQACTSRADQSLSRQKPKICSAALPTGTGSPERSAGADVEAELKFEVEIARRSRSSAPPRSAACAGRAAVLNRRAADANRRGAAVIGDRHVFVVRHQRIVRPEHAPGIAGVENRGKEVGEIGDARPAAHLGLRHRREMLCRCRVAHARRPARATARAAAPTMLAARAPSDR